MGWVSGFIGFALGIVLSAIVLSFAHRVPGALELISAIKSFGGAEWTAVATVVVALIALVTLPITAYQVWHTRQQNKAAVLLGLDGRWEGEFLQEPKKELWALVLLVDKQAEDQRGGQPKEAVFDRSEELFAATLNEMEVGDHERYQKLMKVLSFVETAGYVAKSGYLDKDDIINLFGGVLLAMRRVFFRHIKAVQEKPGTTGRAWRNSEWLFNETKKVAKAAPKQKGR